MMCSFNNLIKSKTVQRCQFPIKSMKRDVSFLKSICVTRVNFCLRFTYSMASFRPA